MHWGGASLRLYLRPINPHRLDNVLHLVLPQVVVSERELVLNLLVGTFGDADATWLGQAFQPCRDVYSISVNRIPFLDYIPKINPDAKLHPPVLRQQGILRPKHLLDLHPTLHRIHHTSELSENIVSVGSHHPAPVLLDDAPHHLFVYVQGSERPLLILSHETTVTLNICAEDGSEFSSNF